MTIDDLRAWLTTCEWQSRFDNHTLARARDYARRRHVVERHLADANASSCVLSGMVARLAAFSSRAFHFVILGDQPRHH